MATSDNLLEAILETAARLPDQVFIDAAEAGIVRYGETYGDDGLWEGSMFVFDDRMTVDFSDHTEVIGRCSECGAPTANIENYPDRLGRELRVVCPECVPGAVPAGS